MTEHNIDINKSILKGKIIRTTNKSWSDYFDLSFELFVMIIFAFSFPFVGYSFLKYGDVPDIVVAIIIFIASLISFFGIYRKITESKLLITNHGISKSEVKKLIFKYFADAKRSDIIETDDCIVIRKKF